MTSGYLLAENRISSKALSLVKFLRPHFLVGGFFLNFLGIALALSLGSDVDWAKAGIFQILISSVQLAGAIANEYSDLVTDGLNTNRTMFSGGSGELSSGRVSKKIALALLVAFVVSSLASMTVIVLAFEAGPLLIGLMVVGLFLGLEYSLQPLSFAYKGLGEPVMVALLSFVAPAASFLLQSGSWSNEIFLVALPLMFLVIGFMIATEYPDLEADLQVEKVNWVVRLGRERAWKLAIASLLFGSLLSLFATAVGLPGIFAVGMAILLLIEAMFFVAVSGKVRKEPSYLWSAYAAPAFLVSGIFLSAVLLLAGAA